MLVSVPSLLVNWEGVAQLSFDRENQVHSTITAPHKDRDLHQNQVQGVSNHIQRDLVQKDKMMLVKVFTFFIVFSFYQSFIFAHVIIKDKFLGRGADTCPRGGLETTLMESWVGPKGPKMTLPPAATSWDSCTHIWKTASMAQEH